MLRKDPFITGEIYHIYNRGIDKRIIFKSKKDYERFIMLLYISNSNSEKSFRLDDILNKQHKKFNEVLILDRGQPLVSIGAWCLMTNHFHMIVKQEIDGGITKFMKKLGTAYSMFFNIKYQRKGALFGGLFKSKLVGVDDNYLIQLFGYIHINPLEIQFPDWEKELSSVSIEMRDFLNSYEYSSYIDYTGGPRIEFNIINPKAFPDYFQNKQSFKNFVENYFIE